MNELKRLVYNFRRAIDAARDAGEFDNDFSFYAFPRGCCGDACDLLAQFLMERGIRTFYVCGHYYDGSFEGTQSHAWLLTDNNEIIDITGDQFNNSYIFLNYNKEVHVGKKDSFHKLFSVSKRDVHENFGLNALGGFSQPRLNDLYKIIVSYV